MNGDGNFGISNPITEPVTEINLGNHTQYMISFGANVSNTTGTETAFDIIVNGGGEQPGLVSMGFPLPHLGGGNYPTQTGFTYTLTTTPNSILKVVAVSTTDGEPRTLTLDPQSQPSAYINIVALD